MSSGTETIIAPPPARVSRPSRWLSCFFLFFGLLVFLQVLRLPHNLDYAVFAFGEPGANLNVAYLVQHGLRPAVDFGHPYGLLEVLLLDVWFRLSGLTPLAYFALIVLLEVLMVAVLTEFVVAAELSPFRIAFIAAALPIFLWMNFLSAAHALETLCLLVAITAHLKGRYDLALSAAAAAVLARPALGYVYGAFLVAIVIVKIVRRELKPSVLLLPSFTTAGLALLLAWRFGWLPVRRTLLPTAGLENYRILDYGFFRKGMAFWWPSPFTVHHYFGVPGFWLLAAGSVILLGPIAFLRGAGEHGLRQRKGEIALASGIVVFVWIFFAFSHQYIGAWILYLFFPALGVSLLSDYFAGFRFVLVLMFLVALNGDRHEIGAAVEGWRTASRSTVSDYMFSYGREDEQVQGIFDAVRNHRTAVLQYAGGVSLMHGGLGEPVNRWFQPGISVPREVRSEKSEIAAAEYVLIPTPPWHRGDIAAFSWPQYLDHSRNYRMVFRNSMGMVLAASAESN